MQYSCRACIYGERKSELFLFIDLTAFPMSGPSHTICLSFALLWRLTSHTYSGLNVFNTAERVCPLSLGTFLSDHCGLDILLIIANMEAAVLCQFIVCIVIFLVVLFALILTAIVFREGNQLA